MSPAREHPVAYGVRLKLACLPDTGFIGRTSLDSRPGDILGFLFFVLILPAISSPTHGSLGRVLRPPESPFVSSRPIYPLSISVDTALTTWLSLSRKPLPITSPCSLSSSKISFSGYPLRLSHGSCTVTPTTNPNGTKLDFLLLRIQLLP